MEFEELRYFFFDLDRTLWNWDETITGAEDLIHTLEDRDRKVFFHTDNSVLSRRQYAEKLSGMGIPAEEENVLTSGYVAAEHLSSEGITETYVIGESGLVNELDRRGIEVKKDAETAVVGLDRQLSYEKIRKAKSIAESGGKIFLLSTEETFRRGERNLPHQGATNCVFQNFKETELLGKPSQIYRDSFRDYFSYFADKSIMIGDRIADIETGNRLGMKTASVMSGELDRETLASAEGLQEPDIGVSHLSRIREKIRRI